MKKLLIALAFFTMMTAPQAYAQMKWRVVAIAHRYVSPSIDTKDSTRFQYSYKHDRGSSIMADTISFDSMWGYSFVHPAGRAPHYAPNGIVKVCSYDSVNRLTRIIESPSPISSYTTDTVILYNAKGLVSDKVMYKPGSMSGNDIVRQFKYDYDTGGRLAYYGELHYWPNNTPINFDVQEWYEYDSLGRIIFDSTSLTPLTGPSGIHSGKTEYFYDTSGKRTAYGYNYNNTTSKYDTTTIGFTTFDSSGLIIKTELYDNRYQTQGAPIYSIVYEYYPSRLLKKTTADYYATKKVVDDYSYNSAGYIEQHIQVQYANDTSRHNYNYYYEHYWPAGVDETVMKQRDITVYPNPTQSILNIKAKWKASGALDGSVTDMQGRVMMRWSDKTNEQYTKQIQLTHLQSGMYFLNLSCGDEYAVKQFMVR
ncbi:MAG: T9SS type A sorting domain-containing protein [Chitinophagales bacterium]|nr:T9SS type A sorting domain-containing protein [Chitinophagaceae bacterium]MCB9066163.1 T9SS type A sorting domain-containing protein [Chitinophagales bacterium]